MKQCTQCNFENIRNRFYCEQCGTLLPHPVALPSKTYTHTPHAQNSALPLFLATYAPKPLSNPPSRPAEDIAAILSTLQSPPAYSRTRTILHIFTRVILYFSGALIASFGLFTVLAAFIDDKIAVTGLLLLFTTSTIIAVILFLTQRQPHLRWWQHLVGEIISTGVMIIILLIGIVFVGMQSTLTIGKATDLVYGGILLLYGLTVATLAVW